MLGSDAWEHVNVGTGCFAFWVFGRAVCVLFGCCCEVFSCIQLLRGVCGLDCVWGCWLVVQVVTNSCFRVGCLS